MRNSILPILRRTIQNERGDALVLAMVLLVVSIISSLAMIEIARMVETNSKRPRAKSMMAATEAKVREQLISPSSYSGCSATGRASCNLIDSQFTSLSRVITGTACPSTKPACGIIVSKADWVPSIVVGGVTVSRADILIRYEGTDFSLKDINVVMDIPADVLQSAGIYECPSVTAPKFLGFNADGTLNCGALPADALPGEYVSNVDLVNLSTTVVPLPATKTCAAGELVSHVQWGSGGAILSHTCAPRREPFAEFGFIPGSDMSYIPNAD